MAAPDVKPGCYKRALVKGGELVPCMITYGPPRDPVTKEVLDRSPRWTAYECGRFVAEAFTLTGDDAVRILEIAHKGIPISTADYRLLLEQQAWDKANDPTAPLANERQRVDLRKQPPPF